jgi:predicted TIM-barrel fold metal-dependent hydrolase
MESRMTVDELARFGIPAGAPTALCRRSVLGFAASALTLSLARMARADAAAPLPPPLADYHLHIQGPAVSEAVERLKAREPKVFEGIDPSILKPRTAAEVLGFLDAAGIRYGALLSEAYMFASPLFAPDKPDVAKLTREENGFNVAEAAKSQGRLKAFISVNPMSPAAAPEIDYWARTGGATGLKLHLANSFFDFKSESDVAAVKGVLALAHQHRLPAIIHLRNRQEWGAAQVAQFVDQMLPSGSGSPVQIAHGAGWGGLDDATVEALAAFSRAIAAHKPGTEALTFDLALVLEDKTDPALAGRFVEVMRSIGMDRFAMASDWPAKYTPADQARMLEKILPLTSEEWRTVLMHRAAYFR